MNNPSVYGRGFHITCWLLWLWEIRSGDKAIGVVCFQLCAWARSCCQAGSMWKWTERGERLEEADWEALWRWQWLDAKLHFPSAFIWTHYWWYFRTQALQERLHLALIRNFIVRCRLQCVRLQRNCACVCVHGLCVCIRTFIFVSVWNMCMCLHYDFSLRKCIICLFTLYCFWTGVCVCVCVCAHVFTLQFLNVKCL